MSRTQQENEHWMQYLDALQILRTQGFPDEPITGRYEILQRFINGVSDPTLRQELAVVFAAESYLTETPIHPPWSLLDTQQSSFSDTDPQRPNPMIPGMTCDHDLTLSYRERWSIQHQVYHKTCYHQVQNNKMQNSR